MSLPHVSNSAISAPIFCLDWLKQVHKKWPLALPIFIAFLSILARGTAWYILRDYPGGTDWTNLYNPAGISVAKNGLISLFTIAVNGSPIYVAFLAAIHTFWGPGIMPVRVGLILVDSLVVLCIYLIGYRTINQTVAALTGLMYALYPPAIYMAGLGQPESLLTLALLAFVLVWLKARRLGSTKTYLAAGMLLGLCLLLKPNYLVFFPFWAVVDLLFPIENRKKALGHILLVGCGVLILTVPWFAFRQVQNDATASSSTYGFVIYAGSNLRPTLANGSLMPLGEYYAHQAAAARQALNTTSLEAIPMLQLGFQNWLALAWPNPIHLLLFVVNKFAQVWYATDSAVYDQYIRVFQLPVVLLGILGTIYVSVSRVLRSVLMPLLLILSYTVLAVLIITPLFREVIPAMPIGLVFTAVGIEQGGKYCARWYNRIRGMSVR